MESSIFCEKHETFRRSILPPSSGLSNTSKKEVVLLLTSFTLVSFLVVHLEDVDDISSETPYDFNRLHGVIFRLTVVQFTVFSRQTPSVPVMSQNVSGKRNIRERYEIHSTFWSGHLNVERVLEETGYRWKEDLDRTRWVSMEWNDVTYDMDHGLIFWTR
jgi:hypothetical protein